MSAYTDLQLACSNVNATLASKGSPYSFRAQSRNGYRALDFYKHDHCVRTLMTGTPGKCRAALFEYAFDELEKACNPNSTKV